MLASEDLHCEGDVQAEVLPNLVEQVSSSTSNWRTNSCAWRACRSAFVGGSMKKSQDGSGLMLIKSSAYPSSARMCLSACRTSFAFSRVKQQRCGLVNPSLEGCELRSMVFSNTNPGHRALRLDVLFKAAAYRSLSAWSTSYSKLNVPMVRIFVPRSPPSVVLH